MENVIATMVIVVGITAVVLMLVLTVQIYRGNARPEDKKK